MARAVVVKIIGSGPVSHRPSGAPPSFEIRGASSCTGPDLRLDRINSGDLIRTARGIYFRWLSSGGSGPEPSGVVLSGQERQGEGLRSGRVVHDLPVLLPEECFVPLELLRTRSLQRSRGGRSGLARAQAQAQAQP